MGQKSYHSLNALHLDKMQNKKKKKPSQVPLVLAPNVRLTTHEF